MSSSADQRLEALSRHLHPSSEIDGDQLSAAFCAANEGKRLGDFKHGGELVAEVLHKQGVKFLFTLIGGHISPIIVSSKEKGIRVIDVRHEVNAVFAADAVSRLSSTPGVACVTAGPGLTNTITAVKNAQMAQSPLILLGGATSTLLKGRGSLQDIDQQSLFAPHVKWQATIKTVREIVPTLEKAFATAVSGVPGPVFIEFPIDTLYPEKIIREQVINTIKGDSIVQNVIRWYLSRHVDNLYAGKDQIVISKKQHGSTNLSTNSQIETALSMVIKAKKPVLVLGSQTVLKSEKVYEVQKAVEKLGIPVYLSGMARGLMGKRHPLHLRHKRGNALKQADLVILVGVPFDFRMGYGQDFSPQTQTISVNLDKHDMTKNRSPSLGVLAEPANFLLRLSQSASKVKLDFSSWHQVLLKRDADRDAEILKTSEEPVDKFLNPLKVCMAMEKSLTEKAILVADGGDFVATASYIVRPPTPLSWLDPGVFGTLGVGAGFAMGAKLCRPESDVWLVWGDGSAGYSIMEYDTFVRHNIPVISVVGNDACWTQIFREQVELFNDDAGCMLVYNDYQKIAESLGGVGYVVQEPSQLDQVFREAKEKATGPNGKPVLINALIGKTEFRKGSISM